MDNVWLLFSGPTREDPERIVGPFRDVFLRRTDPGIVILEDGSSGLEIAFQSPEGVWYVDWRSPSRGYTRVAIMGGGMTSPLGERGL